MDKILDLQTYAIKRLNKNVVVIEEYIDAQILDIPLQHMQEILKQRLSKNIDSLINKNVFYNIYVTNIYTKTDIYDVYDYVENALTDIFCVSKALTKEQQQQQAERESRLGLYGLPQTNLKNINYLRWIKSVPTIKGIGFKVQAINGSWSRRMIK